MGVTLIQGAIAVVGVIAAVALASLFALIVPVAGVVIAVVLIVVVLIGTYLIGQTIWAITKTALYVYAAEERIPDQFDDFDFETLGGRTDKRATPGAVANPPRHLDH